MATKKWYQRKTNWAIAVLIANNLIQPAIIVPYIGLSLIVVINTIAGAFGVYAVADRAGKPPETTN